MADLSWFKYDVDDWTQRVRELGLSFADEGALMRLYRGAWREEEPGTIADNPDEFARLLGAHWERALPLLRVHFTPHPEKLGRLRSAWLVDAYAKALAKHESYSKRGKLGGRPPKDADTRRVTHDQTGDTSKGPALPNPPKPESSAFKNESSAFENGGKTESSAISSALAQLSDENTATQRRRTEGRKRKAELSKTESLAKAELSQSTTEVFSCALTEHSAKNPATEGALAPDAGAALPVANSGTGNGELPPDATGPPVSNDEEHKRQEAAARNGMRADGAPTTRVAKPLSVGAITGRMFGDVEVQSERSERAERAQRTAQRHKLQSEYRGWLDDSIAAWEKRHHAEAAELERSIREKSKFPATGQLSTVQAKWFQLTLRDLFVAMPHDPPIPSSDEWIAAEEARRATAPTDDLFGDSSAETSRKRTRKSTAGAST